jgi:DNA-binding NarL/FixJ family response regulator
MPAYLGGPAWADLDDALARRDFPAALALAEHDARVDVAERQLVIGVCRAMFHQSEQAVAALVESMQTFGAQRPMRAAVAAVFLGRLHYFVHDSPAVANGWFARARRLVADQPDCIEYALAALPLPGCDILDVTKLHKDATRALTLARRIGEANLEAKALADLGTAQVSRAFVAEGMTLLDEAMAMVLSGEASSPFAAIEVVCNLLSSCARVGDLARADQRLLAGRRDHPDAVLPLAALHLARHAWPDAASVARHGIRQMGDDRVRAARLRAICVEAELARGNIAQARADADELAVLTIDAAPPVLRARAELARGRVAEATGEAAAATTAYQAGLHALADNGWPLIRAELHLALARLSADSDPPAAITEARAAHLIYDRLGSPLARASALLLNSLGVPATARPRRADATAALTRRESEVLDLLRGGLSNADIAARHHNSVRTIEHHVSAILTKLGLRSRAEAAAYAASLQTNHRHRASETEV